MERRTTNNTILTAVVVGSLIAMVGILSATSALAIGTLKPSFSSHRAVQAIDYVTNGRGKLMLSNGRTYVGDIRDGKPNGQGTMTYPDGQKYVGQFLDGQRHGQATVTFADGRTFVGAYRDDKRNGQGVLTMPNGEKYVGEYRSGEKSGQGTSYLANGEIQSSGLWVDGKFVGGVNSEQAPTLPSTAPKTAVQVTPAPQSIPHEPVPTTAPSIGTSDQITQLSNFLSSIHLIQNGCRIFGAEAMHFVETLERTYAQQLSTVHPQPTTFNGQCIFPLDEQQPGVVRIYSLLKNMEGSYYRERIATLQRSFPQVGQNPLTEIEMESSMRQPALMHEAEAVMRTVRETSEAHQRQIDAARENTFATSDLLIFYQDGAAVNRDLSGKFRQVAPAKACVSKLPDVVWAGAAQRGEQYAAALTNRQNDPIKWEKLIAVLSRVFAAHQISVVEFKRGIGSGCDLILMWDDADLCTKAGAKAQCTNAMATAPHLEPIRAAELNIAWSQLSNEKAQAQQQRKSVIDQARSGELKGYGFLRVSDSAGVCVETGTDDNLVRALVATKVNEFGNAGPSGSLETGSLEDAFSLIKQRRCGYFAGVDASIQKIIAGLDRDGISNGIALIWITQVDLARIEADVRADEQAKVEAQQRRQKEADDAVRAAKEREAQCDTDPKCRADRDLAKQEAEQRAAQQKYAILTCRLGQSTLQVYMCIGPLGKASISGTFKIRNGDSVKTYSATDIFHDFASQMVKISLEPSFAIVAQANGDDNFVLRLEIRNGSEKVLWSDEASGFGVIKVSH